jgi:hypothetical protein
MDMTPQQRARSRRQVDEASTQPWSRRFASRSPTTTARSSTASSALERAPDIRVVGEAMSGEEMLALVPRVHPKKRRFAPMDDDQIRAVVKRLSRPHPSGGQVIERAAILAAGTDFEAVMAWILAHAGTPEAVVSVVPRRGLHASRLDEGGGMFGPTAPRFVLPPGALA